jgi:hypothetical protein
MGKRKNACCSKNANAIVRYSIDSTDCFLEADTPMHRRMGFRVIAKYLYGYIFNSVCLGKSTEQVHTL